MSNVGTMVQIALLGLPLATGFMTMILGRPAVGLAVLLFLTANVLYVNEAIDLRALGGGFELRDLFLFALWLVVLLRYRPVRFLRALRFPLAIPLSLFLAVAAFSAVWAWMRFAVEPFFILRELRAMASYSTFFLTAIIIQDKKTFWSIVRFLTILACILALISIVQYLAGTEFAFSGGRVEFRPETQGLTRVLLPSSFLINAMLVVTVAQLAFSRDRKERLLLLPVVGLLAVAIALTLSRNLWLADAFVLGILFLVSKGRNKWRLLLIFVLGCSILIAGLHLLPTTTGEGSVIEGVQRRFLEPFQTDLFKSGNRTLGGRLVELRLAWEKIARYPLLGIGLGNRYYDYGYRVWRYSEKASYLPYFIHCGYAWIALKMGIPTFFVFSFFLSRVVWVAYTNFRRSIEPRTRGIAAGLLLSFVGLCISALVVPVFTQPADVVTLSVIMGLIAVERRALANGSMPVEKEGSKGD